MAPTSRSASRPMSKRSRAVRRSTASSAGSRSISRVASFAWFSTRATCRLRGLWRLLPLPCANRTMPRAPPGSVRSPSSVTGPAGHGPAAHPIRLPGSLASPPAPGLTPDRRRVPSFEAQTANGKVSGTSPASHSAVRSRARPPASRRSGARRRTGPAAARGSSGSRARSRAGRSRRSPARARAARKAVPPRRRRAGRAGSAAGRASWNSAS